MFKEFSAAFSSIRSVEQSGATVPWMPCQWEQVSGYGKFVDAFAGATFGNGLYRIHSRESGLEAVQMLNNAYPDYAANALPFAYDWLGRQFAVDLARVESGQGCVTIFDIGGGDFLETPVDFVRFHNDDLVGFQDAALSLEFYQEWQHSQNEIRPLTWNECVGYTTPLFLNGPESVSNLEITDVSVYWGINGQLRLSLIGLEPGSTIGRVTVGEGPETT